MPLHSSRIPVSALLSIVMRNIRAAKTRPQPNPINPATKIYSPSSIILALLVLLPVSLDASCTNQHQPALPLLYTSRCTWLALALAACVLRCDDWRSLYSGGSFFSSLCCCDHVFVNIPNRAVIVLVITIPTSITHHSAPSVQARSLRGWLVAGLGITALLNVEC